MMRATIALLLLRGAGAVAPVGVCWTRNMVDNATARHDLRYVVASARSLRRRAPAVPRCLFTDASPAALAGAGAAGLFDAVLADGGAAFAGRNAGEVALLDPAARGVGAKRRRELAKLRSRVGRILNVARGPYELTLFADDDTYFCDGEALEAALADLHRRRDAHAVRARVMPKAAGERRVVEEARRCVWSHASRARDYSAPLEAKCVDRADRTGRGFCAGAQGGALAVARGAAAAAFAADWLDAYLRLYAREAKDPARLQRAQVESFAADQAPLARAMAANCDRGDGARWSVGALPHALNVRDVDVSTVAGKCAKPVFGPLLMLHQKKYVARGAAAELDGVCAAANGAGGLAWLGRAPNARKPPCDWMTQYRGA